MSSIFTRKRNKLQSGSPYSQVEVPAFGSGAKGFAFVDDFNLPQYDPLNQTPLNFTPPFAFQPDGVKFQLLALVQQSQQGFPFNSMEPLELISQDEYPDVEVSGYGS